ncbi:MAG: nicotinate phosphoribosyltransferase [Thaumarchaeota archaeon]|nr:MAG: nicotinate phosphoribosyltransferase [Nitrososphaerota archaeon]
MTDYDLQDRKFWLANENEIKEGRTTDMYFVNTKEVLQKNNVDADVVMEVYARELPYPQNWGILTGVYEAAKLLEGLPVDVWSFEEGGVFVADSSSVIYEPLMVIAGKYGAFAEYETPLLGLLSSSTSVSTRAARFKVAAGEKLLFSFGTRRVHPALAPMVERASYLAGFDGVSNVLGAELLHLKASGTMPHALIQVVGDQESAWKMYDKTIASDSPRVALVDTFWDEKTEAVKAFEVLGSNLWGVRLDTPASRRGESVGKLKDIADGFGVGTAVAYPPVIDLSAKIVEVRRGAKREFRAKRGGLGGRKAVYRSSVGFQDTVVLEGADAPLGTKAMLTPLLKNGKIVRKYEGVDAIRSRVLRDLHLLPKHPPSISW